MEPLKDAEQLIVVFHVESNAIVDDLIDQMVEAGWRYSMDQLITNRNSIMKPERVKEILVEGSRKARTVAQATMERVRDAVKLRY